MKDGTIYNVFIYIFFFYYSKKPIRPHLGKFFDSRQKLPSSLQGLPCSTWTNGRTDGRTRVHATMSACDEATRSTYVHTLRLPCAYPSTRPYIHAHGWVQFLNHTQAEMRLQVGRSNSPSGHKEGRRSKHHCLLTPPVYFLTQNTHSQLPSLP